MRPPGRLGPRCLHSLAEVVETLSLPVSTIARSHLRLAGAPPRSRRTSRWLLVVRAAASALALAWISLIAWVSAALALGPLLWRRAPMGRRLRPPRREGQVIPFQGRGREALR